MRWEPAMLLGVYKTSDKTCWNVPMRREPFVVSKGAVTAALHGDPAAESLRVSPAPLANTPTGAREGLFWHSQ